jgi:2',3'-cyclic-nucleotide 2'-phosphodiesterase (5'-nucleotidase family)
VTLDDGTPVAPDATTYPAATNDFTNAGGDGYVELADGQGVSRDLLATVLLDYIRARGTISPTTDGRISSTP